jgi:hypothetical protein
MKEFGFTPDAVAKSVTQFVVSLLLHFVRTSCTYTPSQLHLVIFLCDAVTKTREPTEVSFVHSLAFSFADLVFS